MRATEKTCKKNIAAGKIFFLSPEIILFLFRNVFYLSKSFFGNRQQSNVRSGQKKIHVLFGDARPKSNWRAHRKTEKKT